MRTLLVAATAAFLIAASYAAAQQPVEIFKVPAYSGVVPWKQITSKKTDRAELVEWIPEDQSEDSIRDILTKQVFYGAAGQDASSFTTGLLARVRQSCAQVRVNGPKQQVEHGYDVAYAQAFCTNQRTAGKDVDIFVKTIRGNEGLYVVQREFRRPAQPGAVAGVQSFTKEQMTELQALMASRSAANSFLVQSVRLCPASEAAATCLDEPSPGKEK